MNMKLLMIRRISAVLLVVLGVIIAARGTLVAAPLSFIAMGILMVLLGVYRLRTLRESRSTHR